MMFRAEFQSILPIGMEPFLLVKKVIQFKNEWKTLLAGTSLAYIVVYKLHVHTWPQTIDDPSAR